MDRGTALAEGKSGKAEAAVVRDQPPPPAAHGPEVAGKGLMRALVDPAAKAPRNVFGPDGLGTGTSNNLGGLKGTELGDAGGTGGLGLRGAGGYGRSTVRPKPRLRPAPAPAASAQGAALDREAISRVVNAHLGAVQREYERALKSDPRAASTKRVAKLTIGPDGAVSAAEVGGDALGGALAQEMKTWRFPAPEGGGSVVVSYPFYFSMAGDSAEAPSGDFQPRPAPAPNPPTLTAEDRLSTFAVDVDTAAYSLARRALRAGQAPEPSLVRVEELINYFHYDYEPPASEPFSIQLDGARSPVDGSKYILRVGLQARVVSDADRLPANLVFLVDTSCSMTEEDRLPLAKKALKIALEHLGPKDRVAITTYAGGVSLVLPPTPASERRRIAQAIDGLSNEGGTAMESGLTLAYQQAAAMLRDGAITRIIVCSDGDANIGATTHEQMLATVQSYVSEGVTISTIGFGDGNYRDDMMEQIADRGNGNYYYVDGLRQAQRVFGRDLTKMLQDVAQDVKIQVELDPAVVRAYRLVGYENREVADADFRNDRVDAGEIGAGHQVTALYELELVEHPAGQVAKVRVRAKTPRGMHAEEVERSLEVSALQRPFERAPQDLRFAVAVMGTAELLRHSAHAAGWSWDRVRALLSDAQTADPDRRELLELVQRASRLKALAQR